MHTLGRGAWRALLGTAFAAALASSSCSDPPRRYASKSKASGEDATGKVDDKVAQPDGQGSGGPAEDLPSGEQGAGLEDDLTGEEGDEPATDEASKAPKRPRTELDAIAELPTGAAQLKVLCARQGADRVRGTFCGTTPPDIKGLVDLQKALGLAFGQQNDPEFAITGHSSSLVGKHVTSINPRAIIFTPNAGNNTANMPYVAMGFARGEQFVELAANDPAEADVTKRLKFFLVRFQQACNEAPGGCGNGDLLTPAIESNWTGITVYEDEDLKNTVFDCRHCHQPGGPTTPRMLRMQELRNPWTHFMRNNTPGGQQLIGEYQAAKGTQEAYAGIPGNRISQSQPADLEDFVRGAGFSNQPNEFPTRAIERDNNRAAWDGIFNVFASGQAIAVPYFLPSISDPSKLTAMSSSYQSFLSGTLAAKDLPDIRETLKEDDRWAMGLAVKPGSTGQQILIQACSQCHNAKLDQSLTRARFDVDLAKMSAEEIEVAATRIMLPAKDPSRMPPGRFRDLTAEQKKELIDYLRSAKSPAP